MLLLVVYLFSGPKLEFRTKPKLLLLTGQIDGWYSFYYSQFHIAKYSLYVYKHIHIPNAKKILFNITHLFVPRNDKIIHNQFKSSTFICLLQNTNLNF